MRRHKGDGSFSDIFQEPAEAFRQSTLSFEPLLKTSGASGAASVYPINADEHLTQSPLVAGRDEARHDLFAEFEGYDNTVQLHSALGYLTPEQAERMAS